MYRVGVGGVGGGVKSTPDDLIVKGGVARVMLPQYQNVCPGGNAGLSVIASGAGLSYQWKKDGQILANATSATLSFNPVSQANAGGYTVVVSGLFSSVESSAATLTLNNGVAIVNQPQNQNVCPGGNG